MEAAPKPLTQRKAWKALAAQVKLDANSPDFAKSVVVAVFVCAEPIIALLAGPEYLEAAVPMRILIWHWKRYCGERSARPDSAAPPRAASSSTRRSTTSS